jgi:hypothetical protein
MPRKPASTSTRKNNIILRAFYSHTYAGRKDRREASGMIFGLLIKVPSKKGRKRTLKS